MPKKKKNMPVKAPQKSQIAKTNEIEKLIQVARQQPKPVKAPFRRVQPQVDRCLDGASLVSNETRNVRLPLAQIYPKPTTHNVQPARRSRSPAAQTLPLTFFHELELDGSAVVMKDERHNGKGFVPVPVVRFPYVACPPVQASKPFRFLDLPNEIQDLIFEQLIPRDQYQILWVNKHHRTKTLTHRRFIGMPKLHSDVLTRRARQQCKRDADRKAILTPVYTTSSPVSALWVNQQFYLRASRVFYHKSTFIFKNIGTLRSFLGGVSLPNKEAIRALKLIHTPYGHPSMTSHMIWKKIYDDAWHEMCGRIKKEMPNIRFLDLELRMHSTPLAFAPLDLDKLCHTVDFRKSWLIPLCLFKGFRLDRCCVRILSNVLDETILEVASYELRQELMGERWDERKEAKRDAFGFKKREDGVKVLRIMY